MYFVSKFSYDSINEKGATTKVKDEFLINAETFTMAEAMTIKENENSNVTDIAISALTISKVNEVVFKEYPYFEANEKDPDVIYKFFKVKIIFFELDENTGKTKKLTEYKLVEAPSISKTHEIVKNYLSTSVMKFKIEKVEETRISAVVELS